MQDKFSTQSIKPIWSPVSCQKRDKPSPNWSTKERRTRRLQEIASTPRALRPPRSTRIPRTTRRRIWAETRWETYTTETGKTPSWTSHGSAFFPLPATSRMQVTQPIKVSVARRTRIENRNRHPVERRQGVGSGKCERRAAVVEEGGGIVRTGRVGPGDDAEGTGRGTAVAGDVGGTAVGAGWHVAALREEVCAVVADVGVAVFALVFVMEALRNIY